MTEKQTRRRYSKEFKDKAVELAEDGNIAETARRLGINRSMLDRWCRQRSADGNQAEHSGQVDERDLELRRLRAENQRLREERTVLKKATAFFANESN